jgi:hypothetical protein
MNTLQTISRRIVAIGLSVAAFGLLGAAWSPASASAAPRIDLKVLLLGTATTDANFQSWQAALQREGIPFDTIIASSGHTPITSSTLSATLSDGTQEGKYQAVIVSVGGLPICTTTCVSGLAQSEWNALEVYEQTFSVRQLTGDVFPGATYGLNSPTTSGALDGTQGALTTDGKTIFPYLKGPVPMDTGTFGYEATPISTTNFDTLVSGPAGSALVGIYTHTDGVQEMVETFNHNQYQLQAQLLRHGELAWATRGVYLGDQRNYLETNIDDTFLSDDSWDTTTHATDYNPADAIREGASDVTGAATWSAQNNFRIDNLFNGGGSVAWAAGCTLTSAGGTGTQDICNKSKTGTDPLLAQFTANNTATGKPYAASFGWINHTWDHPNVDQGCATQNYIEAEIQENSAWAAKAAAATAGDPVAGGLGLTPTTDPTVTLGAENPGVLVTGEHSGLANLLPGNPGTVDPPAFDQATLGTTGTLPAGTYTWAITDQFSPGGGESTASTTTQTLTAPGSVTLSFGAVCHASDIKIYRQAAGSTSWTLVTTMNAPSTDPPNAWFANPASTTDVTNGGAQALTYTDTGSAGTPASAPPTVNGATESPYQQNSQLAAAFTGVGLQAFGSDSSKPYPNPANATFSPGTYAGATFAPGTTFSDGGAQAEARYPTNIYYNVSTEQQEVDEYNQLYLAPPAGSCTGSSTTTCLSAPATFAQIISSVDQNMFQHVMGNDPRPHYFHQTNMMGTPPAGAPTGAVPNTSPSTGDGLYYTTMNGLLAEYNQYFSAPLQQLSTAQVTALLAEQANWAANPNVSGYIQGNQVTLTNSGAAANVPLTGIPSVGSSYGGTQSGWSSVPAGTSTVTSSTTWPAAGISVTQAPQGTWANQFGSSGYLLAGWDGAQDVSNLPNISATLTQGTRTQWAANSSDVRALQAPDGSSLRNAGAYTDPNAVIVKLGFTSAYSGPISIYALDWNNQGDQESISVDDGAGPRSVPLTSGFSQGDWATFPVIVAAGGTVTITATKTAGTSAEISGVMIGGAGAAPATGGQQLSQGGWVNGVGSTGYDLAAFNGASDLSVTPNATVSLVHGARYQWAANTTDGRALSDPGQTYRNAAAYYDPNQVEVQLTFNAAYTGNLHIYSVDWDSTARRELITVNGQTDYLGSSFNQGAWVAFPISVAAGGTVTITADRLAGANAVLSGIFVGDTGTPPAPPPTPTQAPQGGWVNTFGASGYALAAWNAGNDVVSMPGVSMNVVQGRRYTWAASTTDVRALENAAGTSRVAATYYDPNKISVQLNFSAAYTGNLELYAVDWDSNGRSETITVGNSTATLSSFSQGAWVAFPISVAAGGTVTVTVTNTGGPNAVLSGVFLGGAGTPPLGPPTGPTQAPQGTWVGTFGTTGDALAAWNAGNDVVSMPPGVTANLAQGSRYVWAANTTDVRALENAAGTSRTAATYYDPNQVRVTLTFSAAYTGNLELYAVDWDSTSRRETITIGSQTASLSSDFSQGAWVSFPISVAAAGTVTVTVNHVAGDNAVLSGIFLN